MLNLSPAHKPVLVQAPTVPKFSQARRHLGDAHPPRQPRFRAGSGAFILYTTTHADIAPQAAMLAK